MVNFFIYSILIIPIVIVSCSIIMCLRKEHNLLGWQFKSVIILVVLLFVYTWVDSGDVLKYVINKGEQEYSISLKALEEVMSKNIDSLGLAIGKVYEKYYEIEIFNCSSESDVVKFYEDNGRIGIKLRLKANPVENTIQVSFSQGFYYVATEEKDTYYRDGYYFIPIANIETIDELKKIAQKEKLIIEVKYFKKQ